MLDDGFHFGRAGGKDCFQLKFLFSVSNEKHHEMTGKRAPARAKRSLIVLSACPPRFARKDGPPGLQVSGCPSFASASGTAFGRISNPWNHEAKLFPQAVRRMDRRHVHPQ
jgi:hypothetical protein